MDLYDLINAFIHWRMLLATAIAVGLATTLAHSFVSFPFAAWVAIICMGTGLGVLWDRRSR